MRGGKNNCFFKVSIPFFLRRKWEFRNQAISLYYVKSDRPENIYRKKEYPDKFCSRDNTKWSINKDRECPKPKPRKFWILLPVNGSLMSKPSSREKKKKKNKLQIMIILWEQNHESSRNLHGGILKMVSGEGSYVYKCQKCKDQNRGTESKKYASCGLQSQTFHYSVVLIHLFFDKN